MFFFFLLLLFFFLGGVERGGGDRGHTHIVQNDFDWQFVNTDKQHRVLMTPIVPPWEKSLNPYQVIRVWHNNHPIK